MLFPYFVLSTLQKSQLSRKHFYGSIPMDQSIKSDWQHRRTGFPRLSTQSDPDLQTARFQGRNSGNGCSAARFLRRNTDLGSGTGCWLWARLKRFRYGFCPMLRIRLSIRLRLLHCVRQSAYRDDRVGNRPIRAALRTALVVRAEFSAAEWIGFWILTVWFCKCPNVFTSWRPNTLNWKGRQKRFFGLFRRPF